MGGEILELMTDKIARLEQLEREGYARGFRLGYEEGGNLLIERLRESGLDEESLAQAREILHELMLAKWGPGHTTD